MNDIDKERADFESARQRGVFKPAPDACPTWLATQLREEGWQARAATPQAPAKGTLLVTLDSALAAIEHLSQSNSSGREVDALRMLVDVAPLAPTPAEAEGSPVVFWDKAVGGFYIAGSQIPDVVKARAKPLYAAPLSRQAAVQDEDTARLDWLEQAAESLGGLMLHDGRHPAPGRNGLGLRYMGRTLRQAVDACMPTPAKVSAPSENSPAPTVKASQ